MKAVLSSMLTGMVQPTCLLTRRQLTARCNRACNRSLGCLDPQCVLCEHNPHRRCNVNFAPKYLVNDILKAKCEAPIRVEIIDRATGVPVGEEIPDVQLEASLTRLHVVCYLSGWHALLMHHPGVVRASHCIPQHQMHLRDVTLRSLACNFFPAFCGALMRPAALSFCADVHSGRQCIRCKVPGGGCGAGRRPGQLLAAAQQQEHAAAAAGRLRVAHPRQQSPRPALGRAPLTMSTHTAASSSLLGPSFPSQG
jgi:hypothetical protein